MSTLIKPGPTLNDESLKVFHEIFSENSKKCISDAERAPIMELVGKFLYKNYK